jgi:hypothetical protein
LADFDRSLAMDEMTPFEERFEERLRAFARTGARSVDSAAVARAVAAGHPRSAATRPAVRRLGGENRRPRLRAGIGPWRTRSIVRTSLGAAAAVAVLVSGAMLLTRPDQPSIGAPSPTPTVGPSQSGAAAGPSASPSPTSTPLVWTQASLSEDWPAPVRPEPAGGAIVRPILHKVVVEGTNCPGDCGYTRTSGDYVDPTGDTGSAVLPWVDIRGVRFCGIACLTPDLVTHDRPVVDPVEQWMAYGVVFDTDRDGVADWRYGVDNLPIDPSGWAANPDSEQMVRDELAIGSAPFRAWRTDLHTGRTEWTAGPPYGRVGETFFGDSWTRFSFGGDTTGGIVGMKSEPFYVWASVIMDGRVVATDYAPDVGWLLPSPDAKP